MAIYLPDTNVFSVYAQGTDAKLVARMIALKEDIVVSVIALAEMEYGWRKAGNTRRIIRQREFAVQLAPMNFDPVCAATYGEIKNFLFHTRARIHGNANPIGERDMLIAAQAFAKGAVLVTHNTREFSTIPGLLVEDWQTIP